MTTTAPATAAAQGTQEIQDAGHVDVLIVGAGVSGIGTAHHLRDQFPDRTFVILDAQDNRGGTWWTHRYPGVRSDSDLFTYGYRFKPWQGPAIASGPAILSYLDDVITEEGLDGHIRYQHRVTAASWSTADRRWTVEVTRADTGERLRSTITTTSPTSPSGTAWTATRASSCTRSGGPRTSTSPASGSS
jgi:cation diffusion facilitator CzcD-associated flavoprotein CzcO